MHATIAAMGADGDKLDQLRKEAELEMRRKAPEDGRPSKRQRRGEEGAGEEEDAYQEVGRFDYSAISELGGSGIAGFLATCNFRKEKSATKEASTLLSGYLCRGPPGAGAPPAAAAKPAEGGTAAMEPAEGTSDGSSASPKGQQPALSLIKLACCGVVLLKLNTAAAREQQPADGEGGAARGDAPATAPPPGAQQAQRAVERLLADVEGGKIRRLDYCQRLMPVHTTCSLEAGALGRAGARLAALVAAGDPGAAAAGCGADVSRQLSFGVNYKSRGSETATKPCSAAAAEATAPAAGSAGDGAGSGDAAAQQGGAQPQGEPQAAGAPAPGRMEVIQAVANGFEAELRERHGITTKVDLKKPDWVILVELVPVMGSTYAALCVLPQRLCKLKPQLQIRPVGQGKQ